MDMNEVSGLLDEIFSCSLKSEDNADIFITYPNPRVYDSETEGCRVFVKKRITDETSRNCIKAIVKNHKLKMIESRERDNLYLVIYTPRKI